MFGQDMVILNSQEVAVALLEKRSHKYSDRPVLSILELYVVPPVLCFSLTFHRFGWEWASSTARYGPRLRLHRRLLHQVFHAKAALTYRPKQMWNAYQMLTHLLDDPTRYEAHFTMYVLRWISSGVLFIMHRFSASVVMAVTYGYEMNKGETFVMSMQRAADIMLRFATPQISALCDAFPFSGCLLSDLVSLDYWLILGCHSQGVAGVVPGNGIQV